jgi:hypothetical protein
VLGRKVGPVEDAQAAGAGPDELHSHGLRSAVPRCAKLAATR